MMLQLRRKIFVLTGKRGGFGAMKPMLRLIRDDPALELQLVVTDQHVSQKFGSTIEEVAKEFDIAGSVDMEQVGDAPLDRARSLGLCAQRMSEVLSVLSPDVCVLYGDRGEVLATAMSATALGLPIAHIQGGDLSGSIDEQVRHAVSKLAQLHFPSNSASADRLVRMGEERWRIHTVGDNHLDMIVSGEYSEPARVYKLLDLDPTRPVIVVLQHSETTEPQASFNQMRETLRAVVASDSQAVVIYPCSDSGYQGIIDAINELATGPNFRVRLNLEAGDFWGLLNIAAVLVGNSSAGIIESPLFKLPTINIGRRQSGRLTSQNVVHVDHDMGAISRELNKILTAYKRGYTRTDCGNPYGDGKAGLRIVEVLKSISLDSTLMIKRMPY